MPVAPVLLGQAPLEGLVVGGALLAHFRNGSVTMRPGQRVRARQLLGRCGNSGNSSEPHLHLQDRPEFRPGAATGLPIRFERYLANGVLHRLGAPTSGQFVRQAP
jgi:hypothetical protein